MDSGTSQSRKIQNYPPEQATVFGFLWVFFLIESESASFWTSVIFESSYAPQHIFLLSSFPHLSFFSFLIEKKLTNENHNSQVSSDAFDI